MTRIIVKINDRATPAIKRMIKKSRFEGEQATYRIAKLGAKLLKHHARIAGIQKWRGILYSKNGIHARKRSKNVSEVVIPYYAYELDRWKGGHKVIRRGTLFEQWRNRKMPGFKGRIVYVKPYPFIESTFRSLNARLQTEMNRLGNNIIR